MPTRDHKTRHKGVYQMYKAIDDRLEDYAVMSAIQQAQIDNSPLAVREDVRREIERENEYNRQQQLERLEGENPCTFS